MLSDAASHAPVVLVIEDLHWADHATRLMLAHVTRTVASVPLLVIGSFRVEDREMRATLDTLLDDLRRSGRLDELVLPGLSPGEVGELVSARLGSRAPPALRELLHRRTGGNPFFVEEAVRHLREAQPAATPEQLISAASSGVPDAVRTVIDRRLVRLADPVRIGRHRRGRRRRGVSARGCRRGGELRDDDATAALDAAAAARLVEDEATPGRYHFAHALVRETVLGSLTATRRALLHRRIAEAIEHLPASRRESRLPDLARHLLDAHPLIEPDRVAEVVLRAAERAIGQLAYENAAALLERALAELDVPDPQRAALLLALGDAQVRVGHAEVAQQCFAESARLARAVRDGDLLARSALGAAGFAVTVAPVRADICALLEEAVACVDAASPLRAALLARLSIERYYDARAGPHALERGSPRGRPARRRASAARGAERAPRGALEPSTLRSASPSPTSSSTPGVRPAIVRRNCRA